MSLITPTTKEISVNIIAQLEASLNQYIPLLPKSFMRVLAKVLAGVFILLYKYGGFTFLQIFVATASDQDTVVNGITINPLKFWGRLIGVGDPTPATNAELIVDVTVNNQTGFLLSGSQLVNSDNGVTYITIGSVALDAAVVQATIRAVSDQADGGGAGVIGNLQIGDSVSFANPLPNVARETLARSQVVTGSNAESTDSYRQRITDRFQKRPQGGAYADYEQWGEEAAGIINGYPYTGSPGQVDVYSEATVASSGSPDGIPTVAQLQSVLDLINFDENGLASRRNANTFVNSLPIARTSFDVTVTGISGVGNLAQVQADVTTALEEYFLSTEPFIAGLSIPPRVDQITRTRVSAIVEDIVTAANGTFSSAIFYITGTAGSLSSYVLGEGEKAKANAVVYL
tara:strand:- start:22130 stop:23332 length:1203 start_codon:yes stop_codon:yes gene_type:complete